MHVSIIIPKGQVIVSSILGAFKVLNAVNSYLKDTGQLNSNFYDIDLVGLSTNESYYNGLFNVNATKTIDDVPKTDLVIVTTINGNFNEALNTNAPLVDWIRKQRINNNAEIASLCTGAFMLAATGLLNGKSCATHWIAHDQFRAMFPQVNLLPDKIISEDNGIYSSGGAYSFLNLLLHLVEKFNGREVAIFCSKLFEIEFDRDNQNQYIMFTGQKDHSDESIQKVQQYIENNVSKKISVDALADLVAISPRNFVRRFKKATANTPLEYIQRVKIESAKKSLESTTSNVSQVMFNVGYNDDKSFRNLFKKYTGLSPIEYRKKYNREMVASKM